MKSQHSTKTSKSLNTNQAYMLILLIFVGIIPHLFMADQRFPQLLAGTYEEAPHSLFENMSPARYEMMFKFLVWTIPYYTGLILSWLHISQTSKPCFWFPFTAEVLVLSYGIRIPAVHVLILSSMVVFMLIAELSVCLEKHEKKGQVPFSMLLGTFFLSLAFYYPIIMYMNWDNMLIRSHFIQIILSYCFFFLSATVAKGIPK